MKSQLQKIQKVFENRIRLGIMSALSVNETLDFNALKELLELTDGNLATHLKTLQKHKYVQTKKQFIDNKPNTQYSITLLGKKDFSDHIAALEKLLQQLK
jgi:DNA-binding HxlR family transcriptional regulator